MDTRKVTMRLPEVRIKVYGRCVIIRKAKKNQRNVGKNTDKS